MTSDTIIVTPPTIKLRIRMPRFYGLRLLASSWCISMAGWIAGGALEIEVQDSLERTAA